MKKYTYILFVSLSIFLLSGCSSKSTVKPNLNLPSYSSTKLPYTIAIDGRKIKTLAVNQNWHMADLTVNYGHSLLLSIKHQLKDNFENVFIIDKNTSLKKYDYKFSLANDMRGNCSESGCQYKSKTNITVYNSNNVEIFRKKIDDNFKHNVSGSVFALAVFTGLTLFLASPITMPAMSHIRNNDLNKNISNSNDRVSEGIAEMLARRNLYITNDNMTTKPIAYKTIEPTYNKEIQKLLSKYPSSKVDNKKWLFIIGIEDYSDTDNVLFAKHSAKMFEKVAQKTLGISQRHTYSLVNDKATSGRIKDRLEMLLAEVREGDKIYFYYTGHGIPDPSDNGQPYILPSDKLPSYINQDKFFSLKHIYTMLDNSKAGEVIAFVDSCFSGSTDGKSVLKGVASSRLVPKSIHIDKGKMTVLTAGSGTEFANMYKEKNHRLFSYYLMKSLLNGDKDIYTIYKEVSAEVYHQSNIMGPLYRQEPTLQGSKDFEL